MLVFLISMSIGMLCTLNSAAHFNAQALDELKSYEYTTATEYNDEIRVKKKTELKQRLPTCSSAVTLSFTTVSTGINIAAVAYATTEIYRRYTVLAAPVLAAKGASSWWQTLCPEAMKGIMSQGSFFIDSGGIIVKTLLYKTLAKWLVACGTHDIVDAAEDTVDRGKKVATKLVW